MTKYDPLQRHLVGLVGRATVRMTFAEIEELVGRLPNSAHLHRQWWANNSSVEAVAWRAAGWHVASVDQRGGWVEFEPGSRGGTYRDRQSQDRNPARVVPSDSAQWEGDVQARLVRHLLSAGWDVISQADTATKARGIDVVASHSGQTTGFEVKGFPSRSYSDPARWSEVKPTSPSTQARHWYGSAVLTALLTKNDHPDWGSVIALPDTRTYRNLTSRTASRLTGAGVSVWFVTDAGTEPAT